jgi:hypothetical protein
MKFQAQMPNPSLPPSEPVPLHLSSPPSWLAQLPVAAKVHRPTRHGRRPPRCSRSPSQLRSATLPVAALSVAPKVRRPPCHGTPLIPCFIDCNTHPTIPYKFKNSRILGNAFADTQPYCWNCSRLYEVNLWLWHYGRGQPRTMSIDEAEAARQDRVS